MKRLLALLITLIASAVALWRFMQRLQELQGELAHSQRELASQRARAMDAERQLAQLTEQTAAPPAFSRGVIASDGFVSVDALAAEAQAAAVALDAEAEAQALDELLTESEPPLAEIEVLQASYEAGQPAEGPPEVDVAALASRSGAVELLVSDQEPAEDDLTRLEGIGPTYAGRLSEQGIASFARLARASEDELADIIQAPAWRRPSFADWIAQARLAAVGDEAGLAALQGELFSRRGDNLTLLDGLGAKYATALQNGGIASFAALAASTPEQVAAIVGEAGLRNANYSAWIEEAALRAAGKRVARRDPNADTP